MREVGTKRRKIEYCEIILEILGRPLSNAAPDPDDALMRIQKIIVFEENWVKSGYIMMIKNIYVNKNNVLL